MVATEIFNSFELDDIANVNVLIIEQDDDYQKVLQVLLKADNFKIDCVKNAQQGLQYLDDGKVYNLIIVDAMTEGSAELIDQLRNLTSVPIITLIDPNEDERGTNLVLGGADYDLQKPFTPRRLRAAVTAVLRRSELGTTENNETVLPDTISSGGLNLSLGRLEATINNKKISLSAREFSLLQFLMTNPDRTFTREELAAQAWGWAKGGEMRAVDSAVKRLRSKIEDDSRKPLFIVTERNLGYRFNSTGERAD